MLIGSGAWSMMDREPAVLRLVLECLRDDLQQHQWENGYDSSWFSQALLIMALEGFLGDPIPDTIWESH